MQYTLDQARNLANLTQPEMADHLGMSLKTYVQYEKYRNILRMDKGYLFAKRVPVPFDSIIFFPDQVQKSCSCDNRQLVQ
ncbi:helix-turn-helix transcriptional regulator [Sporosarcina trichiuri]|uniref:helix-turn-helix transcriptional regulator n=1 Tax=Sporosarcina trichiuri TaxID=3056445 RepID=UPI0025B399A7|nr:helix-turn-helix transcriptional regulator [Sporosarcina sp. 0.2-SM1T-5]WJY27418.1 helix-turn-helix transcriptional regulator [Sporosarcina sp. 0.2-SM1T-5]